MAGGRHSEAGDSGDGVCVGGNGVGSNGDGRNLQDPHGGDSDRGGIS